MKLGTAFAYLFIIKLGGRFLPLPAAWAGVPPPCIASGIDMEIP
jgi:hypothetical protein